MSESYRSARAQLVREYSERLGISEGTAREYVKERLGPEPREKVYMVVRGDLSDDGIPPIGMPVKIGIAIDPWKRLDALQTSTPEKLTMFFFFTGGREKERELHERFATDRIRGEWFRFSRDMLAFTLELAKRATKNSILGGRHLTERQRRGLDPLPREAA